MLGGFLALLAAATFAFNNATVRRGVLSGSVAQAMAITVPLGIPLFLAASLLAGSLGAVLDFSATAVALVSAAGIAHFVWSRYCNYRATKAMGANMVAPVQQSSMILTLALAIGVLGEALTPLRAIGIGLIVLGAWITDAGKPAEGRPEKASEPPGDWRPDYAEGYLFAILSTIGYGVSPILINLGVGKAGLGASLAAGLISSVAATLVLALAAVWPGQVRHVLSVEPVAARWFTLSGVLVGLSQIFRYMSLAVAPVSVVVPIQRLSIVFRLVFAWLLNPRHEVFGGAVVLGTVVSLLGAVALSVSTEVVLALLPLSGWMEAVVGWQWP